MAKKEFTKKVCNVLCWLVLIYFTVKFFLGTATTYEIVCILICYSTYGLRLILEIILKIITKVYKYKEYRILVSGFEYLQDLHKERHKLYFTGDIEKIAEYSDKIESFGKSMLYLGKMLISSKSLSQKHIMELEEIISKTKELMETAN